MALRTILAGAFALALVSGAATAQGVNMMIPAGPGGGWDTTGRQVIAAMQSAGALPGGTQFTNKGGAGGTIGLAEFASTAQGKDDGLMVMGAIMVGAIELNNAPVKLDVVTPIARLTNEYIAIVVPASSPIKSVADFVAAFKKDPGAMSASGGSAGGVDHIAFAMIAKAIGVPVDKINYVPTASGATTAAEVIGAKVAIGISGVSEFAQHIQSGRLRAIAVTSDQRLKHLDAPTLKESGVDVVIGNWRGVVGAPGMSDAARKAWVERFDKTHASAGWQAILEKQGWDDAYLSGDAFATFLKQESTNQAQALKDVGLLK